ncbi:hypothetical protein K456DRAFT_1909874 [Colletotrichum gloeosporioides 23]|nr:hypothetical protein K456DRAFT_1909874 [Colletotrichum gloeosporioides 23]
MSDYPSNYRASSSTAGGQRTDYTTVPTSDTSFITVERTATRAPGAEKGLLKPREPTKKPPMFRSWLLEFLALIVSMLSFAGIIATLGAYNGQPQLEFARDVNINTIIAILSTALRAAMAFMATEVIGQSKWEWLETPRPLRHVERLDSAGRGAWGSIKFLFFVSKPNFAAMGALLMITSYVIDPFSQQLAKTYSCNIPSDEKASISVARLISGSSSLEGPSLHTAGINGLIYGVDANTPSQLFNCPSGNCTFTMNSGITHTSVGICKYEADVPFLLGASTSTTTIITFSAAACGNRSEGPYIYNTTACRRIDRIRGYVNWRRNIGVVAANCSLSPCLRHYSGEVSHSTLKEKLVSHEPMDFGEMTQGLLYEETISWEGFIKVGPCEINGKRYDSSNATEAPINGSWLSWTSFDNSTHQAPRQCVVGVRSGLTDEIARYQNTTIEGDAFFSDTKWDKTSMA